MSNPNWNKSEEVKKEEPVAVVSSKDAVQEAFSLFAQLVTLRSIQDHCDLSSDESAALDKTMGPYDRLVEEAASSSVEGQSTQVSFASAMADASECDLLKALCSRCFSADELSKTRTKIATAKQ